MLKKSWILVHPSLKEGWGLSVIEAGSQKTPTVGYNVEGLRDSIINGKTGILVKENPKELARKIAFLINNKKKYREISKNSYEWSQKFSWLESTQKSWKIVSKITHEE